MRCSRCHHRVRALTVWCACSRRRPAFYLLWIVAVALFFVVVLVVSETLTKQREVWSVPR